MTRDNKIGIFANGHEIASGVGEMNLALSSEQPTPEVPTYSNNQPSFEITGSVTIDDQVDKLINDIIRRSKFSRKEVKRMFYAVTHYKRVVFDICLEMQDGRMHIFPEPSTRPPEKKSLKYIRHGKLTKVKKDMESMPALM